MTCCPSVKRFFDNSFIPPGVNSSLRNREKGNRIGKRWHQHWREYWRELQMLRRAESHVLDDKSLEEAIPLPPELEHSSSWRAGVYYSRSKELCLVSVERLSGIQSNHCNSREYEMAHTFRTTFMKKNFSKPRRLPSILVRNSRIGAGACWLQTCRHVQLFCVRQIPSNAQIDKDLIKFHPWTQIPRGPGRWILTSLKVQIREHRCADSEVGNFWLYDAVQFLPWVYIDEWPFFRTSTKCKGTK